MPDSLTPSAAHAASTASPASRPSPADFPQAPACCASTCCFAKTPPRSAAAFPPERPSFPRAALAKSTPTRLSKRMPAYFSHCHRDRLPVLLPIHRFLPATGSISMASKANLIITMAGKPCAAFRPTFNVPPVSLQSLRAFSRISLPTLRCKMLYAGHSRQNRGTGEGRFPIERFAEQQDARQHRDDRRHIGKRRRARQAANTS